MRFSLFFSQVSVLVLLLTALAGCSGTPSPNQSYVQLSPVAPPPAMPETIPQEVNARTLTWRPGYWDYSGGSFSWVSGELIARPSATAVWSPDYWMKHSFGWSFVPGHWQ